MQEHPRILLALMVPSEQTEWCTCDGHGTWAPVSASGAARR